MTDILTGYCVSCKKLNPIVWSDGSIKVCYDCALFFGWDEGKEFVLKNTHLFVVCNACNKKFIPKKENSVKCSNCWKKYFSKKNPVVKIRKIKQEVLVI